MDGSRNHLCILSFLRKFKTNRKESKYAEMEIYKQRPNRPSYATNPTITKHVSKQRLPEQVLLSMFNAYPVWHEQ